MKYPENAMNGLTKLLYVVVALFLLGAFIRWGSHHSYFYIQTIDMVSVQANQPLQYVNKETLFERVKPHLSGSSFYVDLDEAQKVALEAEWVADVHIEKIMPSTIRMTIKEHEPVARWLQDGQVAGLVDSEGQVFQADYEKELPEFDGDSASLVQMVSQYKSFSNELQPLRLSILRLQYTPRSSWSMMLNNGIELRLGKNEVNTRLSRFVDAWQFHLREQATSLDYVDMRYSDGFATRKRSKNTKTHSDNVPNPSE